MDSNTSSNSPTDSTQVSGAKLLAAFLWIASVAAASFVGFTIGANNASDSEHGKVVNPQQVLGSTPSPSQSVVAPAVISDLICKKNGLAQKWEYLASYTIKEGDSITSIAEKELGDASRINEISMLNSGASPVVGSVLYLPPLSVKKSSGNIKQVYGLLMQKNNANWHISFGGGATGPGMVIPGYWFSEVSNRETIKPGECLTILLDDGYKVYSVTAQ